VLTQLRTQLQEQTHLVLKHSRQLTSTLLLRLHRDRLFTLPLEHTHLLSLPVHQRFLQLLLAVAVAVLTYGLVVLAVAVVLLGQEILL
jgi:hypothetical protein